MLERKRFMVKVIRAMKGFATNQEVLEEYNYLAEIFRDPQYEMIDNITRWLRDNFSHTAPEMVIFDRLRKEGLIS